MSDEKLQLSIVHLYPNEMNIYGDLGNIIALKQRCLWRDIDVEISTIDLTNTNELKEGDIYFMGGGQDNDQFKVFDDLVSNKREFLKQEVEADKPFLLICGAFQLFGDYFLDAQAREIKGLGLLPISTKAPGDALTDRCLGNIVTELMPSLEKDVKKYYPTNSDKTIVGFENHGGQTYIEGDSVKPSTKVIYGKGNNAKEEIEGARYRNVFGSYTHGSLLPKNPHFADMLIGLALENKYKREIKLKPLDDDIEWQAHRAAIKKITNNY